MCQIVNKRACCENAGVRSCVEGTGDTRIQVSDCDWREHVRIQVSESEWREHVNVNPGVKL